MNITSKYYKPTPKKWRKFGDSLLAVSTFISAYAMTKDIQWIALTGLGIGVIGKFLTNFFTEDENSKSTSA